jgi:hypothetical protein
MPKTATPRTASPEALRAYDTAVTTHGTLSKQTERVVRRVKGQDAANRIRKVREAGKKYYR